MNAAHGAYSQVRAAAPLALRPPCDFARKLVGPSDPARIEAVWPRQAIASPGVGRKKVSQHSVCRGVQRSHVNLGFDRGAALPDPAGLLEGTGTSRRPMKRRGLADAKRPAAAGPRDPTSPSVR